MIFCSTVPSQAVDLGISAAGAGLASAATGYPLRLQASGDLRFETSWPIGRVASLGLDFLLAGALPSNAASWFVYRGWGGWGLEVHGGGVWQVAASQQHGTLLAGVEAAAGAAMLDYARTTLRFFSPTAELAGLLVYRPARLPYLDLRLTLPVRAWFRPDLSFCMSAGLGLGVAFSTSRYGATIGVPK